MRKRKIGDKQRCFYHCLASIIYFVNINELKKTCKIDCRCQVDTVNTRTNFYYSIHNSIDEIFLNKIEWFNLNLCTSIIQTTYIMSRTRSVRTNFSNDSNIKITTFVASDFRWYRFEARVNFVTSSFESIFRSIQD